jgi:transcriptional regulator with XRE-family HTH domain
MQQAADPPGESFAERLDWLFRNVLDPVTSKPYSVRHVAAALTERGCKISHTHLNNLRNGEAPDPRHSVVEAIAAFFGRPAAFLTKSVSDDDQRDLVHAMSDPLIKQVAMRLVDARLSEEGHAAVVAMIEQVRLLEAAADERRSHPRPHETS